MPAPGSGIGSFVIGESAIGGDPFDWTTTLLSQYANSPILLQLLEDISLWFDPTSDIANFYDWVWNLDTAQGWGLDVWGRIVGVNRVLPATIAYFGFEEAGAPGAQPFNQAPFYSGPTASDNIVLSDDAFRRLIYAKAAANLWDGSVAGLNLIMRLLFPGQVCYVTDGLDQAMTYTFEFQLTPVQASIVFGSGVLPRPAGVAATVVQI